jgi:hypothetical protein
MQITSDIVLMLVQHVLQPPGLDPAPVSTWCSRGIIALSCSSLASAFDHLATQLNGNSELLEAVHTRRLEVDQTVATESETFNHAHLSDISDLEMMPEDFKVILLRDLPLGV